MYAAIRSPKIYTRRKSPVPLIVFTILVLLLGCWLFNLTCKKGKAPVASQFVDYVNQVNPLVERSNELGQKRQSIKESLVQLIADPAKLDEELKALVQGCLEVRDAVNDIHPPEPLGVADAALKICMDRRYRSMEKYRSDIINATSSIDLEIYVNNIAQEMTELTYSDGDYQYFRNRVHDLLQEKGLLDISLQDSKWMANPNEANPREIEAFIRSLRGSEVHGMALGTITLNPSGRPDKQNVFHLPSSEELSVTVVVENQGNRTESNVVVSVTIYSATDPTPHRVEQTIETIGGGEKVSITFPGLKPTRGGVRNVVEIKVSPVPKEAFTENNQKVIYFVME